MKLLDSMMRSFVSIGQLTIIDAQGRPHIYGPGGDTAPAATIRLTNEKLYHKLFMNPELYAGEAYMEGTLVCEQGGIRGLLEVFAYNRRRLRKQPTQKILRKWLKKIRKFHQQNKTDAAKKNVQHHYDLSNEFYRMFLDEDMNYSCAYFDEPNISLAQAQLAKKRHIATKLYLQPGMKVLDIGCGWGGMAMYIAEQFDCQVTGITLSEQQCSLARQRVNEKGLQDKVHIELMDYRNVNQKFDRVVSVGMFEHVGLNHYLEYFKTIKNILVDDGCALVHSIGRKGGPGPTAPWIRKYIFPGGYAPALSETFSEIEKSGLWVTDCEILRLHYAETLLEWDKRFQQNRLAVADLFDERFCRMWEFYLIISEFSFRYGKLMNFQIQLTKKVNSLPITRDYIRDTELANS